MIATVPTRTTLVSVETRQELAGVYYPCRLHQLHRLSLGYRDAEQLQDLCAALPRFSLAFFIGILVELSAVLFEPASDDVGVIVWVASTPMLVEELPGHGPR